MMRLLSKVLEFVFFWGGGGSSHVIGIGVRGITQSDPHLQYLPLGMGVLYLGWDGYRDTSDVH